MKANCINAQRLTAYGDACSCWTATPAAHHHTLQRVPQIMSLNSICDSLTHAEKMSMLKQPKHKGEIQCPPQRKRKKKHSHSGPRNRALTDGFTVMTNSTDPMHLAESTNAPHVNYSRNRMYKFHDLDPGQHRWITGAHPEVLQPDRRVVLGIDFGNISGPLQNRPMSLPRRMNSFNPSIAAAPAGLCPRCKYVAAVRVEPLHQCDRTSPLYLDQHRRTVAATAYFRGTALVVLDDDLRLLGHTWLISAPKHHIDNAEVLTRWTVPYDAADNFAPPWLVRLLDVRLFNIEGRLFATYACKACIGIMLIHVHGVATPDGGVRQLRAFRQTDHAFSGTDKWARGRNQAFFEGRRSPGGPREVLVQPWLGLVGSFGAPEWTKATHLCREFWRHSCGTHPRGIHLTLDTIANRNINQHFTEDEKIAVSDYRKRLYRKKQPMFGDFSMVSNLSASLSSELSIGETVSTTTNLLRIGRTVNGARCEALLGIGHTHRGDGWCLEQKKRGRLGGCNRVPISQRFRIRWGFRYTQFLYTVDPRPPYPVLALSHEWCIASSQDPADCESIQFVGGAALRNASGGSQEVVVSYGVNDCEAKLATFKLERVWGMLKARPGFEACVPPSGY